MIHKNLSGEAKQLGNKGGGAREGEKALQISKINRTASPQL